MRILALITARGGSKGLPGKNIRNFHGHPLIAWTIRQACCSSKITKVILSTDDMKIAEVGRKYGAMVPFMRPEALATDSATSLDVVIHALAELEISGETFDAVLLLQPTSPLRDVSDIDGMIEKLIKQYEHFDAVVAVASMKPSPNIAMISNNDSLSFTSLFNTAQRQAAEQYLASYGHGWLVKKSTLMEEKTFYPKRLTPWLMKRNQSVDIDDLLDFKIAEFLFTEKSAVEKAAALKLMEGFTSC
ncbi:MAG: cytidylyltransferase domain-containing protein [Bacteriovoracia bacterium]